MVCDAEAAEAISERLGRLAPEGTSAEPLEPLPERPVPSDASAANAVIDEHDALVGTRRVRVRAWIADTAEARAAVVTLRDELERFAALALGGAGLREIGPLEVCEIADADWRTSWRTEFPVLRVGHIVVRPPWLEAKAAAGDVVVTINPGQAFGTGLHPTTQLALQGLAHWASDGTLAALSTRGPGLLDVGTGSGILLIAALRLGAHRATGIDIDERAVMAANENVARNGLTERAAIHAGSLPLKEGPAQLVVANLIATLQVELAPLLAAAVAPSGRLVSSGLLEARAAEAFAALTVHGLTLVRRWGDGEWCAAEFERSNGESA